MGFDLKYLIEALLALFLLIVALPLLLLLMLYLGIRLKQSPFFIQERCGLKGKPFKILKLRTLANGVIWDEGNYELPFDLQFIRDSGLDELPQLLNIIFGQMSFIGPRPLLMDYLKLYDARQIIRHEVKPGITGLAQIKGGNALTWKQRLEWDRIYVLKQSPQLNCFILKQTLLQLRRKDAGIKSPFFNGEN